MQALIACSPPPRRQSCLVGLYSEESTLGSWRSPQSSLWASFHEQRPHKCIESGQSGPRSTERYEQQDILDTDRGNRRFCCPAGQVSVLGSSPRPSSIAVFLRNREHLDLHFSKRCSKKMPSIKFGRTAFSERHRSHAACGPTVQGE